MATVRILLGIFCLAATYRFSEPSGYILKAAPTARAKVLLIAKSQVGVQELTGNNDGERVIAYLAYVKMKKGAPWCAAFVSWVFYKSGFSLPKTAWSPDLFPVRRKIVSPAGGDVLGIYFPKLQRIAHAGIVERRKGNWILSIEGNTNDAGSRDGDGVYRKRRHIKTIRVFASWLPDEGKRGAP